MVLIEQYERREWGIGNTAIGERLGSIARWGGGAEMWESKRVRLKKEEEWSDRERKKWSERNGARN